MLYEVITELLSLLIEDVVSPGAVPELMLKVLAGTHLKYIIDCTGAAAAAPETVAPVARTTAQNVSLPSMSSPSDGGLLAEVMSAITPLPA